MILQIYMLAKNFHCSPTDIKKLTITEFNEYLLILNAENAIQKNNIQN